jgi:hypothetical protein
MGNPEKLATLGKQDSKPYTICDLIDVKTKQIHIRLYHKMLVKQ